MRIAARTSSSKSAEAGYARLAQPRSPAGARDRRAAQRVACIVLGAALASVIGCSSRPEPSPRDNARTAFEELRTQLRTEIADPAKRDTLLARADELETLVAQAATDQRQTADRIAALNRNYDTTEQEFLAAFGDLNEKRAARHRRLVEIHAEVRTLATDEEWRRVSKFKKLALEAVYEAGTQPETTP
jgi:hypothetical protein